MEWSQFLGICVSAKKFAEAVKGRKDKQGRPETRADGLSKESGGNTVTFTVCDHFLSPDDKSRNTEWLQLLQKNVESHEDQQRSSRYPSLLERQTALPCPPVATFPPCSKTNEVYVFIFISFHFVWQAEGENEVNNELANRMSLFYAEATPMLKTLSDATTKFVSEVSAGMG